jgi:cyclin-dependent kinase regulatory subunit CKS1
MPTEVVKSNKPNSLGGDAREKNLPRVNINDIYYSDKYSDDNYEYRHIICPTHLGKKLKALGLLTESEWRRMGIQQSVGWEHYMVHNPEPHILLFRRKLTADETNVAGSINK